MSFFSKLFNGDKEAEKAARDILTGIFGNANQDKADAHPRQENNPEPAAEEVKPASSNAPTGPYGGDVPPAEENSFTFNGPYQSYFEKIFREDFPGYRFEKDSSKTHRTIYTFYGAAGKQLILEVMSEKSNAKSVRKAAAQQNIPYLRFYYDHEGWWNTRSYVVERIRKVLG